MDEHEQELKDKWMEKIVMHKIPDLLKLGITLENACEFAKISLVEYEEYKDMKSTEIAAEVKRRIEETIRANENK